MKQETASLLLSETITSNVAWTASEIDCDPLAMSFLKHGCTCPVAVLSWKQK